MEDEVRPWAIVISIVSLMLIAMIGVANVAVFLGQWYSFGSEEFPLGFLGRAVIFGVFPLLGVYDILRRRGSGRLLAISSLLCTWALFLRILVDLLSLPVARRSLMVIPFFMSLIAVTTLPILIAYLGFDRRTLNYFKGFPQLGSDASQIARDEQFFDREFEPTFKQ